MSESLISPQLQSTIPEADYHFFRFGPPQIQRAPKSTLQRRFLCWLLYYPLQRAEDIAYGLQEAISAIYQQIHTCLQAHLIEELRPAGSIHATHTWYHLSARGISAAARQVHVSARTIARSWGADEIHLLQRISQISSFMVLQNVVNTLVYSPSCSLASPGARAAIRWQWKHTFPPPVPASPSRSITCDADAAIVFRSREFQPTSLNHPENQLTALFLYIDLGIVGGTDVMRMHQRLADLYAYFTSPERQMGQGPNPLVLILVENDHQLALWQQAARAIRRQHDSATITAAITNITAEQALQTGTTASPFQRKQRAPHTYIWRDLLTDAICPLPTILPALSEGDIPPGIFPLEDQHAPHHTPRQSHPQIRGHYQQRFQQAFKNKAGPHPTKDTISLLGLGMSQRYMDLLLQLYHFPLATISELAALLRINPRSLRRSYDQLQRWGCIQHIKEPRSASATTTTQPRWVLSRLGLCFLAQSQGIVPSRLMERANAATCASSVPAPLPADMSTGKHNAPEHAGEHWQKGVRPLYQHLSHTGQIYRVLADIMRIPADSPVSTIPWVESPLQARRTYIVNGRKQEFRPHAAFEYRVQTAGQQCRYLIWLHVEHDTKHNAAQTLQPYLQYLSSQTWPQDACVFPHPILLLVTPTARRVYKHMTHAQSILPNKPLRVFLTHQELIHTQGIRQAIWHEIIPASDLSHRSLHDLLVHNSPYTFQ